MKSGKFGAIIFGAILFVGLICLGMCTTKISAGYVGVQYSVNGGIKGEVLNQGWHIVPPTTKVVEYSIGIEQSYLCASDIGDSSKDESFEVPTRDGKGLRVDLAYTYRFDPDMVTDTFTRFKGMDGQTVKDTFIKPNIMSWAKEITATYNVTDVLGDKRSQLNTDVANYLKEKFAPYGIIIETASFTDINPDDTTRQAIQKKVTAQQEQELAAIEAETARINAEKEKEVALIQAEQEKETATINAEKAKIKAEGEAEALRIKAEAEAEANRKIAESLSGSLLEKIKIEKWTGNVPTVQGSSTPIINMGN